MSHIHRAKEVHEARKLQEQAEDLIQILPETTIIDFICSNIIQFMFCSLLLLLFLKNFLGPKILDLERNVLFYCKFKKCQF